MIDTVDLALGFYIQFPVRAPVEVGYQVIHQGKLGIGTKIVLSMVKKAAPGSFTNEVLSLMIDSADRLSDT